MLTIPPSVLYIYLALIIFYSIFLSYRFTDKNVPIYRILIYSVFCPWFLLTHVFCYLLTFFKVHVIYFYSIETDDVLEDPKSDQV